MVERLAGMNAVQRMRQQTARMTVGSMCRPTPSTEPAKGEIGVVRLTATKKDRLFVGRSRPEWLAVTVPGQADQRLDLSTERRNSTLLSARNHESIYRRNFGVLAPPWLHYSGDETGIKPSWTTEATRRPSRLKTWPRASPRAPDAAGDSWRYSSQSSARNGPWNHIA
jgi:hypothetical protein